MDKCAAHQTHARVADLSRLSRTLTASALHKDTARGIRSAAGASHVLQSFQEYLEGRPSMMKYRARKMGSATVPGRMGSLNKLRRAVLRNEFC